MTLVTDREVHDVLNSNSIVVENMYSAMESDDLSDIVFFVYEALTHVKDNQDRIAKSDRTSNRYRDDGNLAYKNEKYQKALICYNKALAHAPRGSKCLKLAYSNRSALLFTLKQFKACVADIDVCFAMDCPMDIIDKLKKRRVQAVKEMRFQDEPLHGSYGNTLFQITKPNCQIPCASSDLEVVIHPKGPKVIAKNNIKVGTVVALEKAFTSATDMKYLYFTCYYCHKMDLNLFPCDGCCFSMFCSNECKQLCMEEFHNIECQVPRIEESMDNITIIRAILKLRNMCNSWDEFISLSYSYRYRNTASVKEIYDGNEPTSVLYSKDSRHFIYGAMFNAAFKCAAFLISLNNVQSFMPQSWQEKNKARRAIARVFMQMSLNSKFNLMMAPSDVISDSAIEYPAINSVGLFPFIGKLKQCCTPNTQVVAVNKSLALVVIQPIKAGTELTTTQIAHWLEISQQKEMRKHAMLVLRKEVCTCRICSMDNAEWNSLQEVLERDYLLRNYFLHNFLAEYKNVCTRLANCRSIYSTEYKKVYRLFRECLLKFQCEASHNVTLDSNI